MLEQSTGSGEAVLMAEKPYIIAIAGASCAGKTSLARQLKLQLPAGALIVTLDSYYRDLSAFDLADREKHNFDEPDALDWDLFMEHLGELAHGREIEKPVYDFSAHTRVSQTESVAPQDYILIEGLFALHREDAREFYQTSVFIEVSDAVSFSRRLERDTLERGRTPESVRTQYEQTVRPMYNRYVRSSLYHADVVVDGEAPIEGSAASVIAHVDRTPR
jgi:uridine kinase